MKYIPANKLIAEIERRRLSNRYIDTEGYENELLEIINSLQEQPETLKIWLTKQFNLAQKRMKSAERNWNRAYENGQMEAYGNMLSFIGGSPYKPSKQEQPETPSGEEVMTMCNQILIDWVEEGKTPEEREQREQAHIRFFELYDEYMERPDVDLDAEIAIYLNRNVLNRINNNDIIEDFTTMEAGELARHFYELGLNARKI